MKAETAVAIKKLAERPGSSPYAQALAKAYNKSIKLPTPAQPQQPVKAAMPFKYEVK